MLYRAFTLCAPNASLLSSTLRAPANSRDTLLGAGVRPLLIATAREHSDGQGDVTIEVARHCSWVL